MNDDGRQFPITDDGRRLSEAHEAARVAGGVGRWIAARLSDGGTNGDVYDDRPAAVRHNDDKHHLFVQVQPGPMPPSEGTAYLTLNRRAAAAGYVLTDPAQTPMRPSSGPLPSLVAARAGLQALHLPPHYQQIRSKRRGR